ncbi:uncharacterized protein LOC112692371 [Sipha flava]|uniref:Uncharacterized protein LOC112692371 n=1 Tax=Sipha flava TaxID=143950 RepID=A0A2S2QCB3_9HEMI|nr:uncharacterized protein LOC112692371 [Sipha flava]
MNFLSICKWIIFSAVYCYSKPCISEVFDDHTYKELNITDPDITAVRITRKPFVIFDGFYTEPYTDIIVPTARPVRENKLKSALEKLNNYYKQYTAKIQKK